MKSRSTVSPHLGPIHGLQGRDERRGIHWIFFERIERLDPKIHAYLQLNRDGALAKARELDRRAKRGEKLGRLAGLGVAVKDNICVRSLQATCASKILEGFSPPYSATAVQRIEREDGIILGKTNMDEFAMGNTTQNSAFGPTLNPWDIARVPGGSSGGSAAAVACRDGLRRPRLGHRRLDKVPRELLLGGRAQADIWARQPIRPDPIREQPGADRPDRARGGERVTPVQRDCWTRPRGRYVSTGAR